MGYNTLQHRSLVAGTAYVSRVRDVEQFAPVEKQLTRLKLDRSSLPFRTEEGVERGSTSAIHLSSWLDKNGDNDNNDDNKARETGFKDIGRNASLPIDFVDRMNLLFATLFPTLLPYSPSFFFPSLFLAGALSWRFLASRRGRERINVE